MRSELELQYECEISEVDGASTTPVRHLVQVSRLCTC